jgi:hypothetical protein
MGPRARRRHRDRPELRHGRRGQRHRHLARRDGRQNGPYAPASFFTSVYHAGETIANPQRYYETMRDRWVIAYLEVSSGGTYPSDISPG